MFARPSLASLLLLASCARQPVAASADVTPAVLGEAEGGVVANGCVDAVKFDKGRAYYLIGSRALLASEKRGGAARTLLESTDYIRYALAPDGVWATDAASVVWLAPGAAPKRFPGDRDIASLAVDAGAMYWELTTASGTKLVRVPRDGSARTELAAGNLFGWVLVGQHLLVGLDGALVEIDTATGARKVLAPIAFGYVAHADHEWVYVYLDGALQRIHRKGSAPTVVARATLFSFSGDRAYYVARSVVRSVRVDGTDDRDEAIELGDHPTVLHVDPPFAYWASLAMHPHAGCQSGSIARGRLK